MDKVPLLFGEVLFDCFEDGSRVLGGAPFNVAWHLQAFGFSPLFISRVGDDPMGREIRDTMFHWGMSTAGLQLDSAHPTGEVRVSLVDGQPSFDIVADRAYDHISDDPLPPLTPALIYHGSLGLRQAQSAAALKALLKQYDAPVFLDVNLRPPWWEREQVSHLLDHTQWLKINDDELHTLLPGPETLGQKAANLMDIHGLALIIVTQGEQGAFALGQNGDSASIKPGNKSAVVDTVGAGDAFASVCIVGLLQEWPLALTLERAQQFASLLVSQRGATNDDPGLYAPLLTEWRLAKTK